MYGQYGQLGHMVAWTLDCEVVNKIIGYMLRYVYARNEIWVNLIYELFNYNWLSKLLRFDNFGEFEVNQNKPMI